MTDPVYTPTTLTLDVSVILSRAHRLLIKLLRWSPEKKVLMSTAKWVVREMESTKEITATQSAASVITNWMVELV